MPALIGSPTLVTPEPFLIDVFADPVCPWCWIGKRRLEAALAARPDLDAVVRLQPYQLNPTAPPEGLARADYLEAKFPDMAQARAMYDELTAIGRDEGIAFRFADIERAPNTLDVHRALRWAGEVSPTAQNALAERFLELYFTECEDISDHAVIARAADEVGIDAGRLSARLATDRDAADVRDRVERARSMGVTGVPCFIFAEKLVVMGAHPPEVLLAAIDRALGDEDDEEG